MTWIIAEGSDANLLLLGGSPRGAPLPAAAAEFPAAAATAAPESAAAALSPLYPDHWWAPEFWNDLRNSARWRAMIETLSLPSPPDAATTEKELADLLALQESAEHAVRLAEIVEEAAGPPAYYRRMLFLDPNRNVQTGAILGRAVEWARPIVMHFKHRWKRPRPPQLEPRLRPAVDCPHHAAFPSGHSTQSHLVALAMGEVTGREDIMQALWKAADRIAENREFAGLHYASDSACGAELARQLLPHFVREHAGAIAKARQEEWG